MVLVENEIKLGSEIRRNRFKFSEMGIFNRSHNNYEATRASPLLVHVHESPSIDCLFIKISTFVVIES